jgi:hypothetical protein
MLSKVICNRCLLSHGWADLSNRAEGSDYWQCPQSGYTSTRKKGSEVVVSEASNPPEFCELGFEHGVSEGLVPAGQKISANSDRALEMAKKDIDDLVAMAIADVKSGVKSK